MKHSCRYAATALIAALTIVSCGDDKTEEFPDKGWSALTPPRLTASTAEAVLDKDNADTEAIRFEWTAAADDGTVVAYDLYINVSGSDVFAGFKRETGDALSVAFTHDELNDLLVSRFGAHSGERLELRACVYARADDIHVEDKASNDVAFAAMAYAAEIVRPEKLYMMGGACELGWDGAVELARDDDGKYRVRGTVLKFGKPNDNKGFKFYTTPDGSYPFYGQRLDGEFGDMRIFASENDGDSQFYPLQHGYASGIYTIAVDLDALRLTLDRTGDVEEFDPDAVLYMLGDGMEYGWDMVEGNALVAVGENLFEIEDIRLKSESSFKFYFHDWTEFIRDADAADYWTAKRKGDADGDIRFSPADQGLGAGNYKVRVDLGSMKVTLTQTSGDDGDTGDDSYPAALYIIGDAMPCGWDLGNAVAMTRTAPGVFEAENVQVSVGTAQEENPKGNGFKFIVSNTEWGAEYGAAGSYDNGYLGWELVPGSEQFYPLMHGFADGNYRIVADIAAGKVTFEKM